MATPTPAPIPPAPDAGVAVEPSGVMGTSVVPSVVPPAVATQIKHSWRAVARTVFQAALSLAVVLPIALTALHIPVAGAAAIVVAACAGLTKVMTIPEVDAFLQQYLPFLAAQPKQ